MQVLAAALPALYPAGDNGGRQHAAAACALAAAWADAAAVTRTPPQRHGSLSISLLLLLARLPGDVGTAAGAAASRTAVESTPGLMGGVLAGVSARLGSPLAGVRQAAMRVGRGLSRLLDPSADLFGDLGVDVSALAVEELWPGGWRDGRGAWGWGLEWWVECDGWRSGLGWWKAGGGCVWL